MRHAAIQRLATALRATSASAAGKTYLSDERHRSEKRRKDPEWLWRALVRSFSTMGGSRAWEKVKLKEHWDQLRFARLASICNRVERQVAIHAALDGAGVRYVPKIRRPSASRKDKVDQMDAAVERILAGGGVVEAGRQAMALHGAEAKLGYIKRFEGIGPKYTRNIWMDIMDEDIAQHTALDGRIQRILRTLVIEF